MVKVETQEQWSLSERRAVKKRLKNSTVSVMLELHQGAESGTNYTRTIVVKAHLPVGIQEEVHEGTRV